MDEGPRLSFFGTSSIFRSIFFSSVLSNSDEMLSDSLSFENCLKTDFIAIELPYFEQYV